MPLEFNELFERAPIVTRNACNCVSKQRETVATIGKRSTETGLMSGPRGSPEQREAKASVFVSFRVFRDLSLLRNELHAARAFAGQSLRFTPAGLS
jgi:hypothetical protein